MWYTIIGGDSMPQAKNKQRSWSQEDEKYIFDNYKEKTVKELAEIFKVTNKAMRVKIERLGIKLKPLGRQLAVFWRKEDLDFLKANWVHLEDEEIAEILGVDRGFNKHVVYRKRASFGIKGKSKRIRQDATGYKYHIEYDKKIFTHRAKMEELLGRKLLSSEIVHHIDGVKSNDDINNLYLCSASDHILLHDSLEKIAMELFKKGVISFDREKGEYFIS